MTTAEAIRSDVARHLGDTNQRIWDSDELLGYIEDGYSALVTGAEMLWETAYLEDVEGVATATLPELLWQIERASWNNRRIDPVSSSQLEVIDTRYQITQGEVLAYLQDKDGLRVFRKYRVPSSDGAEYTVTGTWGIARTITDVSSETVTGTWGIPRRVPGQHPISGSSSLANKQWGIPRRFYQDIRNTRIEYARSGQPLAGFYDQVELPGRYTKYVRWYAMHKAMEHPGPGQNLELSKHFKARFDAGVRRVKARKEAMGANRERQFGSSERLLRRPPRPRMPWRFGVAWRG